MWTVRLIDSHTRDHNWYEIWLNRGITILQLYLQHNQIRWSPVLDIHFLVYLPTVTERWTSFHCKRSCRSRSPAPSPLWASLVYSVTDLVCSTFDINTVISVMNTIIDFSESILLDSLLWDSTVGYPSNSLASCLNIIRLNYGTCTF